MVMVMMTNTIFAVHIFCKACRDESKHMTATGLSYIKYDKLRWKLSKEVDDGGKNSKVWIKSESKLRMLSYGLRPFAREKTAIKVKITV